MRVFIMASGQQRRFHSAEYKQLLKAHDETLLQRMGRQCVERGVHPYDVLVITHHDAIKKHIDLDTDFGFIDLGSHLHERNAGSMAATSPWWANHRIFILLGDVYYTNKTMDAIFADQRKIRFFGNKFETFAASIYPEKHIAFFEAALDAANTTKGKLRKVYQCYVGVSTKDNSYEHDVQSNPDAVWKWITDETQDFDDVSQYQNFERQMLNQYAKGHLP